MKGDFISCYLLLQPTLRNVSSKQQYYRSTIKMHESSPVAAALFFYSISLLRPRLNASIARQKLLALLSHLGITVHN